MQVPHALRKGSRRATQQLSFLHHIVIQHWALPHLFWPLRAERYGRSTLFSFLFQGGTIMRNLFPNLFKVFGRPSPVRPPRTVCLSLESLEDRRLLSVCAYLQTNL